MDSENNVDQDIKQKKFIEGINPYKPVVEKNCEIVFSCYSSHGPISHNYQIDNEIMYKVVEVAFKGNRSERFQNEEGNKFRCNEAVVVELESGIDLGRVTFCGFLKTKMTEHHNGNGNHNGNNGHSNGNGKKQEEANSNNSDNSSPKYKILRQATEEDLKTHQQNSAEEFPTLQKSRELAKKYNLEMKIVDAEWQLDRQRLTIYFTAPQRVDFRELVKDLARQFRTRIELRQISSREETKRIDCGVGGCGQQLCCHSFIDDFSYITLEHARTQQLSNNLQKLSGNCGRLKCCIMFEYENYRDEMENYPPLGSQLTRPDGNFILCKVDIFKHTGTLHNLQTNKYLTLSHKEISDLDKEGKIRHAERQHEPDLHKDIEIPL
jgi:cell fate regulator YaaT (PSP1 superfamily)